MRRRALKAPISTPDDPGGFFIALSSGLLVGGASWALLIALAVRVA
jgi:hypothetical protein